MKSPNTLDDATTWQEKYSAAHNQWQDMKRAGEISIVIAFLLVVATLYAFVYAFSQFDRWLLATPSQTLFYVLLLRILLIFLTPTIILLSGFRFILDQTKIFLLTVYQLKGNDKLANIILNRLLGIPPLPGFFNRIIPYPFIIIKDPTLDENHWARCLGGPATLVIYDGIALYLERDNSFSRVVGPGSPPPFLERYERIKEIVDLRPQVREGHIESWTNDGMRIKLSIYAEVQIDSSSKALEKSSNLRYPFDPIAVKKAAEYTSVMINDREYQAQDWQDEAWGVLTKSISSYITSHDLSELFLSSQTSIGLGHSNDDLFESIKQIMAHEVVTANLEKIQKELKENGIKALNIKLTNIEVSKRISDIYIKYLELVNQKNTVLKAGQIEAERIRAIGKAQADAKSAILRAMTDKLKNLDQDHLKEQLFLSASSIIEEEKNLTTNPVILKEKIAVLSRIFKLLNINL